MAYAEGLLRRYVAVGHYAYQAGHQQRYQALYSVKPEGVRAQAHRIKKQAQRDQIGAPYGKLEEAEQREAGFQVIHDL